MNAIVMAAGEGRRMRPLTERWPKPLLPIEGRPVIASLLRELAAAGFDRVTVVTGRLAEQLEAFVGDGIGFGIETVFIRQPEPLGSADAVSCALRGSVGLPALVSGADTLFTPGDLGRFCAAFGASGAAGAVAVRRDPPPSPPDRFAVRCEDGRVVRMLDDDPRNELAGAPLWSLAPAVAPMLEDLPGPPYELSHALQRAVDAGEEVLAIEIGRTRDLTRPLDLILENFPYLA